MHGGKPTTTVSARYGDSMDWTEFYRFPEGVRKVTGAECIDLDGDGDHEIVVAGVDRPLDGGCLFAFDAQTKKQLWSKDLSDSRQWPDCAEPTQWGLLDLATDDLDGIPGDEVVVVASDLVEYPTRISIINPGSGAIRSTFWHMGQLNAIQIVQDFFGVGRPAIVAKGMNNKLDGFGLPFPPRPYESLTGEDDPRTSYDLVPVVMILDPQNMDGLGPPRSTRMRGIPPAPVYAYGFLDVPFSSLGSYFPPGKTERVNPPKPDEIASVDSIECQQPAVADGMGPWFALRIKTASGNALLMVDRRLVLQNVLVSMAERIGRREEYWRQRWHVIIQDGR